MSERPGVILDAGAFIQRERRDRTMVRLAQLFADARTPLVTSAAVVAQVWRGGEHHQVPIAFLLRRVKVVDLTYPVARLLGRMCLLDDERLLEAARTDDLCQVDWPEEPPEGLSGIATSVSWGR